MPGDDAKSAIRPDPSPSSASVVTNDAVARYEGGRIRARANVNSSVPRVTAAAVRQRATVPASSATNVRCPESIGRASCCDETR